MNKKQVIHLIGKSKWKEFTEFMKGQTVTLNKDSITDYHEQDIRNFF